MIVKSLIIASILLDFLGLHSYAESFDRAIVKNEYSQSIEAAASANNFALPDILPRPRAKANAPVPAIFAKNYILVDADSGKVLLKQAAKDEVAIASTTKIMSAIVVLENYRLDDIVAISADAAGQIGATANFRTGEELTVLNVLKAMLIKSANGAAYALAEHMNEPGEAGLEKFIAAMNQKAKDLGMVNTHYRDPAGLDTTGYSSAYDLFLATKYALEKPLFAEIVKTARDSITGTVPSGGQSPLTIWHDLKNSNRLIDEYQYMGAIGVKTGYMPDAGHVLVSAARRDGHTLIGVVINTFADTAPASADESVKLLDWGWQNIEW